MADVTMGKIVKINLGKNRYIDCAIFLPLNKEMSDNYKVYEMVDPTTNELIYYPMLHIVMQEASYVSKCVIYTINGLSWHRGKKYNDAIGGSPTSIHMAGGATDSKWFYNEIQIHPIHCAYIMQEIAKRFNVHCEIGIYLPGYDGSTTGGYLHFAITEGDNYFYYFDKQNIKHKVDNLFEIVV